MEEPSLWARALGRVAYELTLMRPLLPTYAHLIVSALFPIYAGAHASLTRPSSAAKPAKREKGRDPLEDDDEEEEEVEHKMEGLAPSDALMMPLFAGCALAGLYFLIKWLKDPAILNTILNWYFAIFGVVSVACLVTDTLDMGHSLIFPRRFTRDGVLYHVEQSKKAAIPVSGTKEQPESVHSPLPGFLSYIPLSSRLRELLWADRAMPRQKWTLRLYIHRLLAGKLLIGPHSFMGSFTSRCSGFINTKTALRRSQVHKQHSLNIQTLSQYLRSILWQHIHDFQAHQALFSPHQQQNSSKLYQNKR